MVFAVAAYLLHHFFRVKGIGPVRQEGIEFGDGAHSCREGTVDHLDKFLFAGLAGLPAATKGGHIAGQPGDVGGLGQRIPFFILFEGVFGCKEYLLLFGETLHVVDLLAILTEGSLLGQPLIGGAFTLFLVGSSAGNDGIAAII